MARGPKTSRPSVMPTDTWTPKPRKGFTLTPESGKLLAEDGMKKLLRRFEERGEENAKVVVAGCPDSVLDRLNRPVLIDCIPAETEDLLDTVERENPMAVFVGPSASREIRNIANEVHERANGVALVLLAEDGQQYQAFSLLPSVLMSMACVRMVDELTTMPADIGEAEEGLSELFSLIATPTLGFDTSQIRSPVQFTADGRMLTVNSLQASRVKDTMRRFGLMGFDGHQIETNHYPAILYHLFYHLQRIAFGQGHIGRNIADLGCGTGYFLSKALEKVVVEYEAQRRQGRTNIFAIDHDQNMIEQSGERFRKTMELFQTADLDLVIRPIIASLSDINTSKFTMDPDEGEFELLDTVTMLFVMNWIAEEGEELLKSKFNALMNVNRMMRLGGMFVSVEEDPNKARPSSFLDEEHAAEVNDVLEQTRINTDTRIQLIEAAGFDIIPDEMYGKVMRTIVPDGHYDHYICSLLAMKVRDI